MTWPCSPLVFMDLTRANFLYVVRIFHPLRESYPLSPIIFPLPPLGYFGFLLDCFRRRLRGPGLLLWRVIVRPRVISRERSLSLSLMRDDGLWALFNGWVLVRWSDAAKLLVANVSVIPIGTNTLPEPKGLFNIFRCIKGASW
jgi:hypothetical protein